MENNVQPYDVAGYAIASSLVRLLVKKAIITAEEGQAIFSSSAEILKDAPAIRTSRRENMQLSKIMEDIISSLDPDADGSQKPQTHERQ
ncbi:hypothetical protein LP644_21665 [Escherichia coli]|uniref:hypothetical protein n=1 Tax=Escherichia coli TaxID=562 RepID=UPI00203CDD29|nr:hypothetical protein [Escherichia coli]MCM2881391.1 hypothetical protein [Escherichia coli]HDT5271882.1 hypothetical protein [Escherichia coli]HDX5320176.1 hypothetical protein [Escherichia coli]